MRLCRHGQADELCVGFCHRQVLKSVWYAGAVDVEDLCYLCLTELPVPRARSGGCG